MTGRLEKLRIGLKTDPVDTLKRAARFVAGAVWAGIADILLVVYRLLAWPLPNRAKAGLKHSLHPRVKLDYHRREIFLTADSGLSLQRARACEKEPETVQWIEENIRPGDVFFDVGANVGAYSLVAAKFLDGHVRVYAFEPGFSTYDQLCRNIILNRCHESIHPFMLALNGATGMVEFEYHSLEAGDAEHRLISDANAGDSSSGPVYRQTLFGFCLDDLLADFGFPPPNHIKLDVDGSELAILRGAAKTLRSDSLKSILVEVRKDDGQADQVEDILRSAGFTRIAAHDRGDGRIWNYIFRKEGRIHEKIADD